MKFNVAFLLTALVSFASAEKAETADMAAEAIEAGTAQGGWLCPATDPQPYMDQYPRTIPRCCLLTSTGAGQALGNECLFPIVSGKPLPNDRDSFIDVCADQGGEDRPRRIPSCCASASGGAGSFPSGLVPCYDLYGLLKSNSRQGSSNVVGGLLQTVVELVETLLNTVTGILGGLGTTATTGRT
ncbi:hypothetical protein QBC35DRAFT_476305 [Podospora australis]|uniref:Uncharacterized protein n=1 Tax=Podospora australis TaxID=1536484 RepID=A0AAN6WP62_9PEZI|nr:hypothetical protein QBC35DRAFT_476305 [Podospora australis]